MENQESGLDSGTMAYGANETQKLDPVRRFKEYAFELGMQAERLGDFESARRCLTEKIPAEIMGQCEVSFQQGVRWLSERRRFSLDERSLSTLATGLVMVCESLRSLPQAMTPGIVLSLDVYQMLVDFTREQRIETGGFVGVCVRTIEAIRSLDDSRLGA